jgi:hypothetical protein
VAATSNASNTVVATTKHWRVTGPISTVPFGLRKRRGTEYRLVNWMGL